jgi:hypothetical protein
MDSDSLKNKIYNSTFKQDFRKEKSNLYCDTPLPIDERIDRGNAVSWSDHFEKVEVIEPSYLSDENTTTYKTCEDGNIVQKKQRRTSDWVILKCKTTNIHYAVLSVHSLICSDSISKEIINNNIQKIYVGECARYEKEKYGEEDRNSYIVNTIENGKVQNQFIDKKFDYGKQNYDKIKNFLKSIFRDATKYKDEGKEVILLGDWNMTKEQFKIREKDGIFNGFNTSFGKIPNLITTVGTYNFLNRITKDNILTVETVEDAVFKEEIDGIFTTGRISNIFTYGIENSELISSFVKQFFDHAVLHATMKIPTIPPSERTYKRQMNPYAKEFIPSF